MYGNLINKIEETLVNGARGHAFQNTIKKMLNSNHQLNTFVTDVLVFNKSVEKELRLRYFTLTDEFYMYLKDMCEKLKEYPREGINSRNDILKEYCVQMNNMIMSNRTEFKESPESISKCMYKGILLPFDDNIYTSDEYNSLVIL
jgi:uncharacterized coiled-coil DUF342 family protein